MSTSGDKAMAKTSAVNVDDIVLDERCQQRARLNPEAVQEYAEIYREGEVQLPALDVVDVDGKLILVDGFHRLAGARQAGNGFVRVTIVEEADLDRAIWVAAAANQGHGVRRTNEDKRRAVRMALQKIGIEQSTAEVAAHVGVSRDLVSRIRKEIEADQSGRVKGRDGKSYPKRTKSQDVDSTPCEPASDSPEAPAADTEPADDVDRYTSAAKRLQRVWDDLSELLGSADPVCVKVNEAKRLAMEGPRRGTSWAVGDHT